MSSAYRDLASGSITVDLAFVAYSTLFCSFFCGTHFVRKSAGIFSSSILTITTAPSAMRRCSARYRRMKCLDLEAAAVLQATLRLAELSVSTVVGRSSPPSPAGVSDQRDGPEVLVVPGGLASATPILATACPEIAYWQGRRRRPVLCARLGGPQVMYQLVL